MPCFNHHSYQQSRSYSAINNTNTCMCVKHLCESVKEGLSINLLCVVSMCAICRTYVVKISTGQKFTIPVTIAHVLQKHYGGINFTNAVNVGICLHRDESCSSKHARPLPTLCIVLGCVHHQKAHGQQWVESIGVANKSTAFAMLAGLT